MVTISELLNNADLSGLNMTPGTVLLGEMAGVNHLKFYVVAAVSENHVCVCSVIINSKINPFIQKRPHLLARQVKVLAENYVFLSHDSYINCAQPWKIEADYFDGFKRVGLLNEEDLTLVRQEIINSGMLSEEEREIYQM